MKKVYLVLSTIAFGSMTFGQMTQQVMTFGKSDNRSVSKEVKEKVVSHSQNKAAGDIIYSQNFASGTLGDMTTSGVDGAVWMYDLDGSNGQYGTPAGTVIANTDASNGFAILDANYNTDQNPTHADAYDGQLVSPAIDVTGRPGALLNFYCKYRYWGAYYQYPTVEVSTDNFTTITTFNIGREGIRVNDGSGTYQVSLNFSSYLATATNKTNFKFRINSNNLNLYYLEVDDIQLIEAPQYDIQLKELWLADLSNSYEQTDIPTAIAAAAPLTVQAHLMSKGYGIPTNPVIAVGIYDASGTQVGATQTGGTLNNNFTLADDTITFITTFDLSTLAVGTYTVRADINITQTDYNTDNDTMRRTFNRTTYSYGQRNYDLTRAAYSPGVRYSATSGQSNPMVFGNIMYVPVDMTLHGMEVTIANDGTFYTTTQDAEVSFRLYQMDFTNNATFLSEFGTSLDERFFKVTANMIPAAGSYNDVVFNFHDSESSALGFDLLAGNYYYIGMANPGGTFNFSFASNFDDFDYSSVYFDETETNAYVINRQAHTRMNFDPQLAIIAGLDQNESNGLSIGNVYPNPTNGQTSVNFKLNNTSNVTVNVVDITGKAVYTSNEGAKNAGSHNLTFDASTFTSGVYYVTITTDNTQVTKKLIKK